MAFSSLIVALVVGYLFGMLPSAYLLGRLVQGIDIREYGSGNVGASNATIVLGWRYGVLAAVVDILKSYLAMHLVALLFPAEPAVAYVAGIAAILGHIFPFVLRFRGGKGVAALIGLFFGLDWRFGLLAILLTALLTWLLNYIVFPSLMLFTALPPLTYTLGYLWLCVGLAVVVMGVAYYKHAINIRRLLSGEEVPLQAVMPGRDDQRQGS